MGFECVNNVEGGVGDHIHVAFTGGCEKMKIRVLGCAEVMGEGSAVGLDRLGACFECRVDSRASLGGRVLGDGPVGMDSWRRGEIHRDGDQSVVLVETISAGFKQALSTFRRTFLPAIMVLPSADQDRVNGSPPTSRRLTQFLERTSQNRTVPSVEQLAISASRTGLKITFSMPAE